MGVNSCFKTIFSQAYSEWRQEHPGVPFRVPFWNIVFLKAWETFIENPNLERIIKSAFLKAKLYILWIVVKTLHLRNPDTTPGLVCNAQMIERLKEIDTKC